MSAREAAWFRCERGWCIDVKKAGVGAGGHCVSVREAGVGVRKVT